MNCPHCFAAVEPDGKFCQNCGAPLGGVDASQNAAPRSTFTQPTEERNYSEADSLGKDAYAEQRPSGKMSFAAAIKKYYKNYFNLDSRATIAEYWYVALYRFIVMIILYPVTQLLPGTPIAYMFTLLLAIFSFANLIPDIAIAVRRLHDIGKSGKYYFMIFIPLAGPIIFLVYMCSKSTGDNRWGLAYEDEKQ